MKINFLVIFCFSLFFWFELAAGEVRIIVSNIEEKRGTIHYGVYNNPETLQPCAYTPQSISLDDVVEDYRCLVWR